MLRHSLRLIALTARNSLISVPFVSRLPQVPQISYLFSKNHKQGHESDHKHQHKHGTQDHYSGQKDTKHNKNHEEKTDQHSNSKKDHKKGQQGDQHENHHNCKKDHGHHHQSHKQPKNHSSDHSHQKGDHNHHQANHPKLSSLSFDELIENKSEQALNLANSLYEKEQRKLSEIKEQLQHAHKNINFYRKIEEELKEKQKKLQENIKTFEEESSLSIKRAQREVQQSKSFAVTKIAKELLEVADCIANCSKFAKQKQNDQYTQMVVDSQKLIQDILKKYQIEEFDPINKQFDPNTSEGLVNIPTPPGYQTNHVAMTMRTGYTIKGRLLRSARVGVFV